VSHDLLREQAIKMIADLREETSHRPFKGETATMLAALVAVLDAYGPLIQMVNEAGEKALQACIHAIERQPRMDYTGMDMEVVDDGAFIDRDKLLDELLRLNGYVEAEEIVAAA
jgi:hypothetical protein